MSFEDFNNSPNLGFCERCSCTVEISDNDVDRLYCDHCYDKISNEKCSTCNQKLMGAYVDELNKFWHVECFTCAYCGKALCANGFDGMYIEVGGHAYHQDCCFEVQLYPLLLSEFTLRLKDVTFPQKKMTADVAMQTAEVQTGVDGTLGVYAKVAVVFTLIGTFAAVFYAGSRIGKGE
uniref:LIM zinc-binding domain-containing protein n=1 Tax=Meloidogyne enterolobii TaxID=390850 RepID=A0A6V7U5Z8_MELEN|nr:unnamed protein product [Meloidogyne enterolobii]